jgi:hypothetical protein
VTFFGLMLTPLFYVLVRKFAARPRTQDTSTAAALLERPAFGDETG